MAKRRPRKQRKRVVESTGFEMGNVVSVRYLHKEDRELYVHEFGPGVLMLAMEDGSLRIYKPGSTVWSDL